MLGENCILKTHGLRTKQFTFTVYYKESEKLEQLYWKTIENKDNKTACLSISTG